jgi:hypothetical protein
MFIAEVIIIVVVIGLVAYDIVLHACILDED